VEGNTSFRKLQHCLTRRKGRNVDGFSSQNGPSCWCVLVYLDVASVVVLSSGQKKSSIGPPSATVSHILCVLKHPWTGKGVSIGRWRGRGSGWSSRRRRSGACRCPRGSAPDRGGGAFDVIRRGSRGDETDQITRAGNPCIPFTRVLAPPTWAHEIP